MWQGSISNNHYRGIFLHGVNGAVEIALLVFCACLIKAFCVPSGTNAFSYAWPAPQGQELYFFSPSPEPQYGDEPDTEAPLGFGSAASGGSMFHLDVEVPAFLDPVDVYLAVTCDALFGDEIYMFTSDNTLVPLSTATKDIRFRAATLGNTVDTILQDFPVSMLPPYEYVFFMIVTPMDSFDTYIAWVTSLDLTGAGNGQGHSSGGSGSGDNSAGGGTGASGGSGSGGNTGGGGTTAGGGTSTSPGQGGGTAGTVAGAVLTGLGAVSSGDLSNAVNVLVSTIQEGTLDSAVAAVAARSSTAASMITKSGNGYKVDFGTGYTFSNGTTVSGSVTVAMTKHQVGQSVAVSSRQAVAGSFRVKLKDVKINGVSVPDDTVDLNLQADVLGQGGIEGVLAVPGPRAGFIFDTRRCPRYPLAGYLKIGDDIVNITPGCTGKYTVGGNDIPVLESLTPSHIARTNDPFSTSITLHGKNLWPPYQYDHEGGLDADYNYRCHLRIGGYTEISDAYIKEWTTDSITFSFPRSGQKGTFDIYMECPWANRSKVYYDDANKVTLTVD